MTSSPTTKTIGAAALAGGGVLDAAQGVVPQKVWPDEEGEPLVLKRLTPTAAGKLSAAELRAMHDEAHDAWTSLAAGAESWTPRERGSRAGRRLPFAGVDVVIEHDKGDVRSGKDSSGKAWSQVMQAPYGYIAGTVGLDGDPIDVYLGPDEKAVDAYVVHQARVIGPGEFGGHDEDKVMLGFGSAHAAREAYLAHYPDARFLGSMTTLPAAGIAQALQTTALTKEWRAAVVALEKRAAAGKLAAQLHAMSKAIAGGDHDAAALAAIERTAKALEGGDVDVEKAIFSSNSSKRAVADKLASVIPPHRIYNEPFIGSGSVFFNKAPADLEILNDLDDGTARAYRAIKDLSPKDLSKLERMDWKGSPITLRKLAGAKPRNEVDWLHKFLYFKRFSIFHSRYPCFRSGADGSISNAVDKIKKHLPRMKNVHVMSGDYERPTNLFDGPDTFHYFDPPYLGTRGAVGEDATSRSKSDNLVASFDEKRFEKVLGGLKGKWMTTLLASSPLIGKLKAAGADVRYFWQQRKIANWRGGSPDMWQALVANFPLPDAEWLKDSCPPEAMKATAKAAARSMSADDVAASHAVATAEMLRRGMPHDSDLPPLFPERSEESGLGEQHEDEGFSKRVKAIAKAAGYGDAVARAWLTKDTEAAQAWGQRLPTLVEGATGEGAVVTVEVGLTADQVADAAPMGWEPAPPSAEALKALEAASPATKWAELVERARQGDDEPLRAATRKLWAEKSVNGSVRKALTAIEPPVCHTLVMLKGADEVWQGFRCASPGAQHARSSLLLASEGVVKALADARAVFPHEPKDHAWGYDSGRWGRSTKRGAFTWKAGRQSPAWREIMMSSFAGDQPLADGLPALDGAWVLHELPVEQEKVLVFRRAQENIEKSASITVDILEVRKADDLRTVTGVVLQPEITDAQKDIYNADTIRAAAWKFLASYNKPNGTRLGFMHSDFSKPFELVESWIAPVDLTIGGSPVKAGSWVMTVRVLDDRVWAAVKEKKIRGFSIGGMARVMRLAA